MNPSAGRSAWPAPCDAIRSLRQSGAPASPEARTRTAVTRAARALAMRSGAGGPRRLDATSGRRRVAADAVDEQPPEAVGELVRVAAGSEPGVRPVQRREGQERGRRVVEVGAELAQLASLAEEPAPALLVAAPLGEDLVAALALEVAPLAHEDRGHVELLRDDAQVRTQREADLLRRRQPLVDRVQCAEEGVGPLAHRHVQQLLLRDDVPVDGALLDAHRLGQVADRGAVVTALGEEAGGLAG